MDPNNPEQQQQQPPAAPIAPQPPIAAIPPPPAQQPFPFNATQLPLLPSMMMPQQQQQQQQPGAATATAPPPSIAAPGMTNLPFITDPNALSQLSGIPIKTLLGPNSQAMLLAAQQIVRQRLIQHQILMAQAAQGVNPFAFALQQQQQLQRQQAAAQQKATTKGTKGRGKSKSAATAANTPINIASLPPNQRPYDPNNKQDPGGRVLWIKLSNYPWWPAKTIDESKDASYPLNTEPPRPTSFAVRFFGTYDVSWVGSKRQVAEWKEGMDKGYQKESTLESFSKAIEEAETYLNDKVLPDVFYIPPEAETSARKASRARRTSAGTSGGGGGNTTRAATHQQQQQAAVVDRATMVQQRKKQRLLEYGLQPPVDSPYGNGKIAENPSLVKLAIDEKWDEEYADEMDRARKNVVNNSGGGDE